MVTVKTSCGLASTSIISLISEWCDWFMTQLNGFKQVQTHTHTHIHHPSTKPLICSYFNLSKPSYPMTLLCSRLWFQTLTIVRFSSTEVKHWHLQSSDQMFRLICSFCDLLFFLSSFFCQNTKRLVYSGKKCVFKAKGVNLGCAKSLKHVVSG